MATITQLPQELLETIAMSLQTNSDLLNLSRSSKRLQQMLVHLLYQEIMLVQETSRDMQIVDASLSKANFMPMRGPTPVRNIRQLKWTIERRPELKKAIKGLTVFLPTMHHFDPSEWPFGFTEADHVQIVIGKILQTGGGAIPRLRIITDGPGFPYEGHVTAWYLRSTGDQFLTLSLDDLYNVAKGPKLETLLVGRTNIRRFDGPEGSEPEHAPGTCNVKHLRFRVHVDDLPWRDLKTILQWPRALESFVNNGNNGYASLRAPLVLATFKLVKWLRPHRQTLKTLNLLPDGRQWGSQASSRRLVRHLPDFTCMETLHISLEDLQYFPIDRDLDGLPVPLPEPTRLPPNLKSLHLRVMLNLKTKQPDLDDMAERRDALEWIAMRNPELRDVTLDMMCPGSMVTSWGPSLIRSRTKDLIEARQTFCDQSTAFTGYIILHESGYRHLMPEDEDGWTKLRIWLRASRAHCLSIVEQEPLYRTGGGTSPSASDDDTDDGA